MNKLLTLATGITASATQTQVGATGLTRNINIVTSAGTTGDSVRLPDAVAGLTVEIVNTTGYQLNVFPASGDIVGVGSSANANVTLQGYYMAHCIAYDSTHWIYSQQAVYYAD